MVSASDHKTTETNLYCYKNSERLGKKITIIFFFSLSTFESLEEMFFFYSLTKRHRIDRNKSGPRPDLRQASIPVPPGTTSTIARCLPSSE